MFQVIFWSLIGGVLSLIGGLVLIKDNKRAQKLALYATPFAAGVLLAAAFTDLLPEAIELAEAGTVLLYALGGILSFFLLERYLRFFHHHHDHEDKSKNSLVIVGDTLHNALDGVAIGAAFLISPSVGIVTTIAVAAHEIPQEIGDFGLLIKNGMKRSKVLMINVLSALATTVMAVLTYTVGEGESAAIPYLLAITAGFFIYIAASDIIPEIHDSLEKGKKDIRPWILLFGAALMIVVSTIAHDYIAHDHEHDHDSHSTSEHEEVDHNHDEEELHEEADEHHKDDALHESEHEH